MSHLITNLCKEENRGKTSTEGRRNKDNKEQELERREREQGAANKAGEKIRYRMEGGAHEGRDLKRERG